MQLNISEKFYETVVIWDNNGFGKIHSSKMYGSSKISVEHNLQKIMAVNRVSHEIEEELLSLDHFFSEYYLKCSKSIGRSEIEELKLRLSSIGVCINHRIMLNVKQRYRINSCVNSELNFETSSFFSTIMVEFEVKTKIGHDVYRREIHKIGLFIDLFQNLKEIVEQLCQNYSNTHMNLITKVSDDYDIILPAGIGGIFIHEAVGHCLEADNYNDCNNIFHNMLGKRITTKKITISDLPIVNESSEIYSDDGNHQKEVVLIEEGIVTGIMTDKRYSRILGISDTGNGYRYKYDDFCLPRMRNTFINRGDVMEHDIIKSIKRGIIAAEIGSGNVLPESGTFVFQINRGLLVENGEITGMVAPFLYMDTVRTALDRIDCMGNEMKSIVSICNKKGQFKYVQYGSPMIKIARQSQ